MSPSKIQTLANIMRLKREEGEPPYVLFLGSGASLASGCSSVSEIVRSVTGSDDLATFYDVLDGLAPNERAVTLRKHFRGTSASPGYRCLAELVRAGYFDVIFTTNFDTFLEDSLTDVGMRKSDLYVLINGVVREEQINRLMKEKHPRVKILKLHGDLTLKKFAFTPTEIFSFPQEVDTILREQLSRDVIFVGYGARDNDVNRCLQREGDAIWYVDPEVPIPDKNVVYQAMGVRGTERNIISGSEGQFDDFFLALRYELIGRLPSEHPALAQEIGRRGPFAPGDELLPEPPPPPSPTLAQEIESRGPFAPDEAIHLTIELCHELARGHEAGLSHTPLQAESVLYIDDTPTVQLVEIATAPATGDQDAERASDALGVGRLLYEMLTKMVPDDSPSSPSAINPAVPLALDRLVLQSLTPNAFAGPEALQKQRLEVYWDGTWLPVILEREKRFPIEEGIWQAIRLCNQLEHHHTQGLSHHDLSSDNVMLVDVGDKRHARWIETAVLSTEGEIAEGEATEDVYAVGAILYEMLTGHPPSPDSDERALFSGASSWVRLGLDQIVLKALSPEPAERYRDVVILRERLYQHLPRLQQAEEIDTLIRASYPIVYIVSWEEDRVLTLLRQIAEMEEKPLHSWTLSQGLRDAKGRRVRGATELENPAAVLDHIIRAKEEALYVLSDFHPFLRRTHYDDIIRRRMRDLAAELRRTAKALVIVAPTLEIPTECEKDITVLHFGLPTPGEIADVLDETMVLILESGGQVELSRDDYEELVRSATGLTLTAAERAFTLACMRKAAEQGQPVLDRDAIEIVLEAKEHALYTSSALEIFSTPEDFGDIGGLEALKEWAAKRARAFTIEAQDFGLPAPKGVLLIGVPGCGKSLAAKAIASEWKKPLLRLDAGALFSSRMGSSEENLRNVLQVAEAIAPSILWIDEIEKSFSGSHTIDDGGVTARVLGGLITWLQEKTAPVFVVATANSIGDPSPSGRSQGYARSGGLPPELLRKGRFDELFFVDLPDQEERKQIFEIHVRKRGHDPAAFNLDELAKESEGYSGAEIEQAVLSAMYEAFAEPTMGLSQPAVLRSLKQMYPLSTMMRPQIEALRQWARDNARSASRLPERVPSQRPEQPSVHIGLREKGD